MARPQSGDRVNNYLLDECVGTGTFGEVWKAHHHVFDEFVAIKIPTDPQYVRYLQREAMTIHGLRHPNIVRAIDLDPYDDPPYLIMEYVDGPSLRSLIDAHDQGLPIDSAMAIVWGTLSALEVAHRANVIHRDIKPANILIAGGDDVTAIAPNQVKVTDFGLGHVTHAAAGSILQSGSMTGEAGKRIAGTVAYLSPEHRDGQPADGRSDLYSLGIVLHEILTGKLPQGSDPISAIRPEAPRWIDRVFEKCYTRRERRFASAERMRAEIKRYWRPDQAEKASKNGRPDRVRHAGDLWQCQRCGGQIKSVDQFCIHCGGLLVDRVMRCPSCHAYVEHNDNYCILCGTDLRKQT